jgi:hypothetical protein
MQLDSVERKHIFSIPPKRFQLVRQLFQCGAKTCISSGFGQVHRCGGGGVEVGDSRKSKDWVDHELAALMQSDLDAVWSVQLRQWHRTALFYALRLALAPAIESLLLLDRLLFLREAPGSIPTRPATKSPVHL